MWQNTFAWAREKVKGGLYRNILKIHFGTISGVYRIFERGGRIEKGGARENFIRYFMKFDIFETIFSANLVHFIKRLARFPRIYAQILFKTDFLFFFLPEEGGSRTGAHPPICANMYCYNSLIIKE